jgi:hypothetical protein
MLFQTDFTKVEPQFPQCSRLDRRFPLPTSQPKAPLDRNKVRLMPVDSELNPADKSRLQFIHEVIGAAGVALPDEPAWHKLQACYLGVHQIGNM